MSLTLIVVISALMASLIGLKIYFENKQEQEIKSIEKTQDTLADLHTAVVNPTESTVTVEQPTTISVVETVEVTDPVVEVKPKKKKRYYPKKKQGENPKPKKQTKK